MSRRTFLAAAAGAAALGAAGCSSSAPSGAPSGTPSASTGPRSTGTQVLPDNDDAPFDTVVILMMENRSFDHLLGWFPGANGKQEGLSFVDSTGKGYPTWNIAPDFQ